MVPNMKRMHRKFGKIWLSGIWDVRVRDTTKSQTCTHNNRVCGFRIEASSSFAFKIV